MSDLDIALESLEYAINSLNIFNSNHNTLLIANEGNYIPKYFSKQDPAMEGIIDKIKSIFLKNNDAPKTDQSDQFSNDNSKSNNNSNEIMKYTKTIATVIAKDINPLGDSVPLTFSWLCSTDLAELFMKYTKENPQSTMAKFVDYALDNVTTTYYFAFHFYDKKSHSIQQSSFTSESNNPYFKNALGFTFKEACHACMIETLKRLLSKKTYDEYGKDGIPMAYTLTCTFNYKVNNNEESASFTGFNIDEDLMTGMTLLNGTGEALYLPNQMDKKQMNSKAFKLLMN